MHLVSGIVLSVLVELLVHALVLFPPLRNLDDLGADHLWDYALNRIDEVWNPKDKKIVFVSIDDDSLAQWHVSTGLEGRGEIAELISDLRRSQAAAVMVDIVFEASTADDHRLRAALTQDGVPVILAAPDAATVTRGWVSSMQMRPGTAYPDPLPPNVTFASARVLEDEDGEVRRLRSAQCVQVGGQWRLLPSLARATAAKVLGDKLDEAECSGTAADEPISFLIRPERGDATAPVSANPWFRTISAADVPKLPADFLRNTIVVLGQNNLQSDADKFKTPLGLMPGALVQANALAGRIRSKDSSHNEGEEDLLFYLQLFSITAISGLIYLGFSKSIQHLLAGKIILSRTIAKDHRSSLLIFILDSAAFLTIGLVAATTIYHVTLTHGLVLFARGETGLGQLLPVLGFALEAFIEYGVLLMVWVERLAILLSGVIFAIITVLSKGLTAPLRFLWTRYVVRAALLAGLTLACGGAMAQTKSTATQQAPAALLRLLIGKAEAVRVERSGTGGTLDGDKVLDLFPGDKIRVLDQATRVKVMYLGDGTRTAEVDGRPGDPYVVQASSASPESMALWRPFREVLDLLQRKPAKTREPRAASIAGISNLAGSNSAARQATSAPRTLEDSLAMSADASGGGRQGGDWQIDLGSFAAEAEARNAATVAGMVIGAPAGSILVTPILRSGTRQYRARIADVDQLTALEACGKLRPRHACSAVSPEEAAAAMPAPLRHAAGLDGGSYFIAAGATDFPVAWSGGSGSFVVQLLGPKGDEVLAAQTVQGRLARVPAAPLGPAGQGRVRIIDQTDDSAIGLTVTVAPQPKLAAGSLGRALPLPAAAYLYTEAPGWRIEGLRRFMDLAAAGDADAQPILEGILAQ